MKCVSYSPQQATEQATNQGTAPIAPIAPIAPSLKTQSWCGSTIQLLLLL